MEGTLPLQVSKRDDSSSLRLISELQAEVFRGTSKRGTVDVDVRPLDGVLDVQKLGSPLLVKVDVQGSEAEVLKGAPNVLAKADFVYIEASFVELYSGQELASDVITRILEAGFELRGVYNADYHSGQCVQADFLFARKGQN